MTIVLAQVRDNLTKMISTQEYNFGTFQIGGFSIISPMSIPFIVMRKLTKKNFVTGVHFNK